MNSSIVNIVFTSCYGKIIIQVNHTTKVGDLIKEYFKKIEKSNLLTNNLENIYFIFSAILLNNHIDKTIESLSMIDFSNIEVINGVNNNYKNFEIIDTIKENIFTSVYKAKILSNNELVAIKKIFKDKIKDEMKYSLCKKTITDKEFEPIIKKFNKEIENTKKCQCENSVSLYDYYDKEKEFIIIMELCDETLFDLLCEKENGFNSEEIKEILLQLNNVFKKMHYNKISHRDIKLNNILIKYYDEYKTRYKVLLSDYGISNQLYSLTQKFTTHAGSQLIMAPEILNDEDYTDKCDLWSLGIIIYQLYTKDFPYKGNVEKAILNQIQRIGLSVLDNIDENDNTLKDLLSKLLVRDPNERMTWEEYFNHPFFN